MDFDQMSNSTAYATSSWQTCTDESATVPTRMKAVISGVRARKRVSRPWESMATPGQKVSSNTKKTFRRAMMRLRAAKAQSLTHSVASDSGGRLSARELNEDLLELRLASPGSRAPAHPARAASAGSRAAASPPRPPCTRCGRPACAAPARRSARPAPGPPGGRAAGRSPRRSGSAA